MDLWGPGPGPGPPLPQLQPAVAEHVVNVFLRVVPGSSTEEDRVAVDFVVIPSTLLYQGRQEGDVSLLAGGLPPVVGSKRRALKVGQAGQSRQVTVPPAAADMLTNNMRTRPTIT
ncbi:hypothetical protein HaLaN_25746 [Haematococcus lacustris]|uniref:Uncharacterized protein n=1 Tax=Haematococcus lacustris TaxID=44745 RepID=A0A699ZWW6_HAELA|nr:hypothetical protein HaLaN_25746 [Haematococcus lacustris]